MEKLKLHVGISIGDMNGVGMEVILKTFLDSRMMEICTPIVYGSSKIASYYGKALDIKDFRFNIISEARKADLNRANLINCWKEEVVVTPGESTQVAGKYAVSSLKAAVEDLASNNLDVLVTAPINKENVQSEHFNYPGHTEFLADYANEENPLMIMIHGDLRIGVVTGHIALKDVSEHISKENITQKLDVLNRSLCQDFGIRKPKIAVLGLNPHAGDKGVIGKEENEIIVPAINKARTENILAFGPYSADGFFGSDTYKQFDGVLAMYHDQGLVPFKTLSFGQGVNYTAGLPIVRTSPDHGTGYDIAGKGIAVESSFRQAVYQACDIFRHRKEHRAMTANPLELTQA